MWSNNVIKPHTENTALAEKFVDMNSAPQIPVWQAEARTSYHVTSWEGLPPSLETQPCLCNASSWSDKSAVFSRLIN